MSPHDVWVANGRCPSIGPKTGGWCLARAGHQCKHWSFQEDPREDEVWPLTVQEEMTAWDLALADELEHQRYGMLRLVD